MDEQFPSQNTPPIPTSTVIFKKHLPSKKILIILAIIITLVLLGIGGFFIFQNKQNQYTFTGLRKFNQSLSSFNGKVIEKGPDYLMIAGGGQTIKAVINPNINIRIVNKTEFLKNPKTYIAPSGKLADINIGDLIDVTGQLDETILKVSFGVVTK